MGKCVYCKGETPEGAVLDVCRRCGIGVWGEKMFNAIVGSMEERKDAGDLYQGSVTMDPKTKQAKSAGSGEKKMSIFSDAMKQMESTKEDDVRYDSYNKMAA